MLYTSRWRFFFLSLIYIATLLRSTHSNQEAPNTHGATCCGQTAPLTALLFMFLHSHRGAVGRILHRRAVGRIFHAELHPSRNATDRFVNELQRHRIQRSSAKACILSTQLYYVASGSRMPRWFLADYRYVPKYRFGSRPAGVTPLQAHESIKYCSRVVTGVPCSTGLYSWLGSCTTRKGSLHETCQTSDEHNHAGDAVPWGDYECTELVFRISKEP